MFKKLLSSILVCCFLSGCNILSIDELKAAEEVCSNNGGLHYIYESIFSTQELAVCKNGAEFVNPDKLIESRK